MTAVRILYVYNRYTAVISFAKLRSFRVKSLVVCRKKKNYNNTTTIIQYYNNIQTRLHR